MRVPYTLKMKYLDGCLEKGYPDESEIKRLHKRLYHEAKSFGLPISYTLDDTFGFSRVTLYDTDNPSYRLSCSFNRCKDVVAFLNDYLVDLHAKEEEK